MSLYPNVVNSLQLSVNSEQLSVNSWQKVESVESGKLELPVD